MVPEATGKMTAVVHPVASTAFVSSMQRRRTVNKSLGLSSRLLKCSNDVRAPAELERIAHFGNARVVPDGILRENAKLEHGWRVFFPEQLSGSYVTLGLSVDA